MPFILCDDYDEPHCEPAHATRRCGASCFRRQRVTPSSSRRLASCLLISLGRAEPMLLQVPRMTPIFRDAADAADIGAEMDGLERPMYVSRNDFTLKILRTGADTAASVIDLLLLRFIAYEGFAFQPLDSA